MLTYRPLRAGSFIVKNNGFTIGIVKPQGDLWCPFGLDGKWTGTRFSSSKAAAESLLVTNS